MVDQAGYWEEDPFQLYRQAPDPLDYVREFSKVTSQSPTPALYAALIQEEQDEWRSAYLKQQHANELKELADLVYVIYGYANSQGWDLTAALHRVHENNLGRVTQDDGTIKRREDGKIIKNPNAPKIELEDLL